jgi:hypothetical protein
MITVDSTDTLADRVNDRPQSHTFRGVPKEASGLSEFSPPKTIQITVMDLLLSIGRITTPRIDNLVDLCSTWASIRYIWAFSPDANPSRLRLSEEALLIDFHQKSLLSDEVGVGMAGLIIENFFNGKNPIDVDVAIRSQYIVGLGTRFRTSPDYLFERSDGTYIIVECKGTRSGFSNTLSQLKRGTEQVPSLVFPGGGTNLELVIGTNMSASSTDLYVIDPPNNKWSGKDNRKHYIEDKEQFTKDVDDIQFSNLYLYTGVTGRAAELMPRTEKKERLLKLDQQFEPPYRDRIPEMQEDYVGISRDVPIVGDISRIRVFQGIPASMYHHLENREKLALDREATNHFEKARQLSQERRNSMHQSYEDISTIYFDQSQNILAVSAFGRDGNMMRLIINK